MKSIISAEEILEFDAILNDDGSLVVPSVAREKLKGRKQKLRVRIMSDSVSDSLRLKGVTVEEIVKIASLQLEQKSQVVKCLRSEGRLRRSGRLKR